MKDLLEAIVEGALNGIISAVVLAGVMACISIGWHFGKYLIGA